MFLRATTRKKDGKEHRYWSIVENRRFSEGRVLQRHVLYLGEINASQKKIMASVADGNAIQRLLDHLGEPIQAPHIAPGRGPPWQKDFEPCQSTDLSVGGRTDITSLFHNRFNLF